MKPMSKTNKVESMNQIEIQAVFESAGQPDQQQIQLWIDTALDDYESGYRDCCSYC